MSTAITGPVVGVSSFLSGAWATGKRSPQRPGPSAPSPQGGGLLPTLRSSAVSAQIPLEGFLALRQVEAEVAVAVGPLCRNSQAAPSVFDPSLVWKKWLPSPAAFSASAQFP